MTINTDADLMSKGVDQLLGFAPYSNKEITPPCNHEDDGYTYGSTPRYETLKCSLCGDFYEQKIY